MSRADCAALDATIRAIIDAHPDLRPNEIAIVALYESAVVGQSEAFVFLAHKTIRDRAAALEASDALRRIEVR